MHYDQPNVRCVSPGIVAMMDFVLPAGRQRGSQAGIFRSRVRQRGKLAGVDAEEVAQNLARFERELPDAAAALEWMSREPLTPGDVFDRLDELSPAGCAVDDMVHIGDRELNDNPTCTIRRPSSR